MTKFGVVTQPTQVGRSMFLGVRYALILRGRGPSVPKIFETSYMRAHSMRNNNQILHGDQTQYDENFHTVDHEC